MAEQLSFVLCGALCYSLVKEIPNLVVGSGAGLFFPGKKSSLGRKIYCVRHVHKPIYVEEY